MNHLQSQASSNLHDLAPSFESLNLHSNRDSAVVQCQTGTRANMTLILIRLNFKHIIAIYLNNVKYRLFMHRGRKKTSVKDFIRIQKSKQLEFVYVLEEREGLA